MKRTIVAATLLASATAFAVPASAMDQELTMLELAVKNVLDQHGITDVDVMSLTVSQLAIISNIVASDDGDTEKSGRIRAVLAR